MQTVPALFSDDVLPALVAAVEQSPIGLLLLDGEGYVTFETLRFRASVGEGQDDSWAGRRVDRLPGLSEVVRERVRALVMGGTSFDAVEGTFERADGTRLHLVVSGSPVQSQRRASVVTVLDVTEWREGAAAVRLQRRVDAAESALRTVALGGPNALALLEAAAAQIRTAFDATGALALVDADGRYVRCAASPPDASPGVAEIDAAWWPAVRRGRSVVVARGEPASEALLADLACPCGLVVPFSGAADGVFVLARDVPFTPAERIAAERLAALVSTLGAWAEADARFRRTVADLDDALFTTEHTAPGSESGASSGGRHYLFVTPQAEAVTGLDPDALLAGDADWASLVVADDRAAWDAHDARLRAGERSRVEVRLAVGDDIVWVRERASPSTDAAGRLVSGGLLADITAEKLAEARLEEARAIAERTAAARMGFLRMMSHELRTPIGAVRGFAELLEDEIADLPGAPDVVEEFVGTIRESSDRALTLVTDLLELSRLETGGVDLRADPVDLGVTVAAVASNARARLDGAGVTLRVEADAPVTALGDAARLENALERVLDNAVRFTPKGEVVVTVGTADGRARITVRDTGIGIGADFLPLAFDPFTQEDSRINRAYGGSGLGLAIARRLVEHQGGTLTAVSTPDQGSTFVFGLPAPRPEDVV